MAASYADNDVWHVMIADDMKRMNVEQLDDAFRLSLVDASTLVWKAGMRTWQSLGAVAGLEDEEGEDSVTRLRAAAPAPPPPPRPLARPAPKPPTPRRLSPAPAPARNPFLAGTPLVSQPFAPVVAPVAPTARRAELDSAVDFRRKGRGVRWGRWATLVILLAVGVLGSYRQNLLREGAHRIGVENKYLYGERRVTGYVSAKAPPAVKRVLTQLALLPGPNAEPAPKVAAPSAPPSPPPALTVAPAAPLASSAMPKTEPEVQTVALTSLPVLQAPEPPKPPEKAAPVATPRPAAVRRVAAARPAAPTTTKTQAAPKAEPALAARPAAKPASSPSADENPLKAAIRSAIAADAKK